MNTEPRRWTLHRPVNDGNTYATGSYSDMREHIPVIEAAAYDALLAERDALKMDRDYWQGATRVLRSELAALKVENAELDATTNMQHLILDATATVLKGPPAPLSLHSFADLAQVAAALKDALRQIAELDCDCDGPVENACPACHAKAALTTSATESREAKGGEQC